ncbi:MAG: metal-dependent transcriptional regulator [Promethearchaeota archaeon]
MIDIDYKTLKYLYRKGNEVKVGQIAREFSIPHSTIGSCIKKLKNKKYLIYKPYGKKKLSKSGIELAKELIRHAQLFEVFLYNELNLDIEEIHRESEKINFLFSCNIINNIW